MQCFYPIDGMPLLMETQKKEYYKYNLEKEHYYLFLFQPYYHNIMKKYQQTPYFHF
jgi:hypothetical protein